MKSMKKKKNSKKEKISLTDSIEKDLKTDNEIDIDEELLGRTLQGLKEDSEVNPDLENFFEKVKKQKEEINDDELTVDDNPDDIKYDDESLIKPKSSFGSKFKVIMLILAFIASIIYYLLFIKDAFNHVNYIRDVINSSGLLVIFFFIIIALTGNKKLRNIFSIFSSILIIGIISLNLLNSKEIIKLPTLAVLNDFTNTSIADVMKWASANKIDIETTYEYSDNVDEGEIIAQSVEAGSVIKLINKIKLTVSSGPNYDKELILSSFVGRSVDDLIDYINNNHLNNVNIAYEVNNDIEKDIIISQSIKGEIKRNSAISFVISLGNAANLKDIKIDNLVNKTLFDASFYLKRNGIKYELSYEFSSKIKVGKVISQDPTKGTKVSPNSTVVKLVISKGKEIIVPDFSKSTVDEVVAWIIKNNLKVEFAEKYSITIDKDKLVSVSVKTGESITEGTKVTVITSKGSLTVASVNSLAEFRSWAGDNGISYTEKYEYSTTVQQGKIISLSIKSGEKIDPESQSIVVTISYGSPVTVPYFVGMSKGSIQSTCYSKGLNCTFYYTGYNGAARDTALLQNVASGTKVVNGTYVNIGLSSGPAQTFSIYLNSELFESSYASTVSNLTNYLNSNAPGVAFKFVNKASTNVCVPGLIDPNSPIKGGVWNSVTQGNTYTIWVMGC